MKIYEYYQPEYVKEFKCDGQKCNAHCCRNWAMVVDKKTYKKYSHVKPKSAAKELTRPLKKIEGAEIYKINLDEKWNCPFLNDNLCTLQQKYGAEFVPEMCANYPRRSWDFQKYYERALSLTCPQVAEQVLLQTEPLQIEKIEVPEEIHSGAGKFQIEVPILNQYFFDCVPSIQATAIKILQERTLSIDGRLLLLEFYCDKMEELLGDNKIIEIEKANEYYNDAEFLRGQFEQISPLIKFDAQNHLKIILAILKLSYESIKTPCPADINYFDAVINALAEDAQFGFKELAEKYLSLSSAREQFLEKFSTVFENYLAHEFFSNFYPFNFAEGITHNCNVFLIQYKMLELVTFSQSLGKNFDIVPAIVAFVEAVEHNPMYIQRISEYVGGKNDIGEILKDMLQV